MLDSKELSSLLSATRAIADEIVQGMRGLGPGAPLIGNMHALIIDGRDTQHRIPVFTSSRAARLLDKDPRAFGAAVKQLYLSGPAGGAGLRELLEPNESMETDQPEPSTSAGRLLAASASTPTFWRGERDAAG